MAVLGAFVVALACEWTASALSVPPRPLQRSFTSLFATWSDSKAVQDYQNFLASGRQEIELKKDCASVIIKSASGDSDQLARALVAMGMGDDLVLTPDQDLPERMDGQPDFPIYITLPPYELEDFLNNLSSSLKNKNENFCFFSGGLKYGNIEDILKERGYCRDSMTQVLISGLKVTQTGKVKDLTVKLGTDSYGERKIAGQCTACGLWHGAIAERLERSNIECQTDFYRDWRRKMWERSLYDAVFHLLGCVRNEATSTGDVARYYGEEVSDLVWEMSQLLRGWKAITLMYGFEERLFGFAESAEADEPCRLDSRMYPFIWGNFVYLQSKSYVEYLTYAQQEKGLLPGIALPVREDDDYTSKMRQGNLRADGKI